MGLCYLTLVFLTVLLLLYCGFGYLTLILWVCVILQVKSIKLFHLDSVRQTSNNDSYPVISYRQRVLNIYSSFKEVCDHVTMMFDHVIMMFDHVTMMFDHVTNNI